MFAGSTRPKRVVRKKSFANGGFSTGMSRSRAKLDAQFDGRATFSYRPWPSQLLSLPVGFLMGAGSMLGAGGMVLMLAKMMSVITFGFGTGLLLTNPAVLAMSAAIVTVCIIVAITNGVALSLPFSTAVGEKAIAFASKATATWKKVKVASGNFVKSSSSG